MKKFFNITSYFILGIILLILWEVITRTNIVPSFMLPSPISVAKAFTDNLSILIDHTKTSLLESFIGILISIILAFTITILMDSSKTIYKAVYPIIVITQTIPTIAIAPLLVLWLGYDIAPKVALIVIVCFFPIAISLLQRI